MKGSLQVIRINLLARKELISATVQYASAVAKTEGMKEEDLPGLELVLEEAMLNVIEHAFEGDPNASFEVIIEVRPPSLVVSVEDKGLPFNLRNPKESMGMQLMRAFAERVEFINLGRQGKRVELVKSLPYRDLEAYLGQAPEQPQYLDPDTPLELRLMRPEDTPSLARCAYRCYGFSYSRDALYRPEKFENMLRQGLIVSAVALTPEGEVVAHVALSRQGLKDKIADSGQAVTDPRVRGKKLFTSLKDILILEAKRIGLLGVYSESVTIHPFTQKGNLRLGATETALLLGFAPADVAFKHISEAKERSAVMMTYLRTNPEPPRTVYPPARHFEFIKRTYEKLGLNRELSKASAELEGEPIIDATLIPELRAAHLCVQQAGLAVGQHILRRLPQAEVVYLDLPLSLATTPAACLSLEAEGFSFAGIVPEAHLTGDVLRLQKLQVAAQRYEDIHTASEWGKELKQYVFGELR